MGYSDAPPLERTERSVGGLTCDGNRRPDRAKVQGCRLDKFLNFRESVLLNSCLFMAPDQGIETSTLTASQRPLWAAPRFDL